MADLEIKFLGGESVLNGMLTSIFGMHFRNFIIGSTAGFTPTGDETAVLGTTTFIGSQSDIKVKMSDENRSARISMLIAGDYDNIVIGNIVLYANTSQGVKPLLMVVLPEPVYKNNTASDILQQGFPYPETRMVISITIKYLNANDIETSYTVDIITPEVANLPFFGSDLEVPIGSANPWSQFIVNEMTLTGGAPALVTKDINDQYYATPLFQNINNPKYGILDGGGFETNGRSIWVWGLSYETPIENYNGLYGGIGYDSPNINLIPILGGAPY